MSPSSLYQLFEQNPTTPFRLTLASGDKVIVDNPLRTLIVDLELYVGQADDPKELIGRRLRIVSIPNITLVEKVDASQLGNGRRRRRR